MQLIRAERLPATELSYQPIHTHALIPLSPRHELPGSPMHLPWLQKLPAMSQQTLQIKTSTIFPPLPPPSIACSGTCMS